MTENQLRFLEKQTVSFEMEDSPLSRLFSDGEIKESEERHNANLSTSTEDCLRLDLPLKCFNLEFARYLEVLRSGGKGEVADRLSKLSTAKILSKMGVI